MSHQPPAPWHRAHAHRPIQHTPALHRVAIAAALCLLGMAQPAAAQTGNASANATAQTGTIAFNLPTQPLGQALTTLAQQAGAQVLFSAPLTEGKTAPALQGSYSVEQGLDRLLAGSGLVAHRSGNAWQVQAVRVASAGEVTTLPEVVVTAPAETQTAYGPGVGYVAERSTAGTKADTPILTTPQSISVVTREQMDDQQVLFFSDALRYTPGIVTEQSGPTSLANNPSFRIRGFADSDPVYVDGLAVSTGTPFDAYFFDRIEVVGGPASVLYGQGTPGGIVNMVSKRPTFTPLHEVIVGYGNHNRRQLNFDLSGPLNADGTLAYRLTGTAAKRDTQVNAVKAEEYAIAPALTWKPTSNISWTGFAKYIDRPSIDRASPFPLYGTYFENVNGKIPRSNNMAHPNQNNNKKVKSVGYDLNVGIGNGLSFQQRYARSQEIGNFNGVYDNYSNFTATSILLPRSLIGPEHREATYQSVDNHLLLQKDWGGIRSTSLIGTDYKRTKNNSRWGYLATGTSINVFDPLYEDIDLDTWVPASGMTDQFSNTRQLGLYAEQQFGSGGLNLIGSIRRDRYDQDGGTHTVSADNYSRKDVMRKNTFRVGGSYLFSNGVAPYISYATSFTPQYGNDFFGTPYEPQQGKQTEVGIKYQPADRNLMLTAAVFDLRKTNVPTSDEDHPGFSKLIAGVRSRGLELSARGEVTRNLQLISSYTYINVTNTDTNNTATGVIGGQKVGLEGRHPAQQPKHAASLWASYRWSNEALHGLTTAAGLRYRGSSWGDDANSYEVPGYTLVDLSVAYDLGLANPQMRGWQAQLNVSNLFDKDALSCSGRQCYYGMARSVYASLRYRW